MPPPLPPDALLVEEAWARWAPARGLDHLPVPDAWAFGGTAAQADDLLALVLSGAKTATASALWCYEDGEALPAAGDLGVVCDGRGRPGALLRVTEVTVTALDEVPAAHAAAEGEGDRTLAWWRRTHEDFFRRHLPQGRTVSATMPVVLERFERLAP